MDKEAWMPSARMSAKCTRSSVLGKEETFLGIESTFSGIQSTFFRFSQRKCTFLRFGVGAVVSRCSLGRRSVKLGKV